jgi:DNA-directed RNA polymerase subunit RPC12/RpoP
MTEPRLWAAFLTFVALCLAASLLSRRRRCPVCGERTLEHAGEDFGMPEYLCLKCGRQFDKDFRVTR